MCLSTRVASKDVALSLYGHLLLDISAYEIGASVAITTSDNNVVVIKNFLYMNEGTNERGWWGQNIALYVIAAIAVVLFVVWLANKSGKDSADLAASIQKLYGQVECITPMVNKYADRVDAIGNAVTRTAQAQADFQAYANSLLTDLDNAVFAPRYGGCGCNNGCGTEKFKKETQYTAGATTLVETDTCRG